MKIKAGVTLLGTKPELLVGMMLVNEVYARSGYDFILTSVCDGTHMPHSKHNSGYAFDCRIRHLPDDIDYRTELVDRIQQALGNDWDALLEVDHIHVEYDP